ncbi:transporter [Winogradskyella sp. UBA3174]|uniref:transporter n=1 Tax=Winogradskyella sp. UBA3174 TaxID=1947785 RepID=UPI0025FF5B47|nr:transporter [Winogradskyella sp. UBA3174]|tara:strand:- start:13121 stop:14050 length:930 start_codon:yes stop_codon:yes gene_type:complete
MITRKNNFIIKTSIVCAILCFVNFSFGQDIEPRRWNPLPLKTNVLAVGYANTSGDILFDPLLQAEDVTVKVNSIVASYIRPFKIGNKAARFDVVIPFVNATWKGLLNGVPASARRDGFSDPRIRLSVNLTGAPASTGKELQEYLVSHPVNTTIGVSLAVTLPLGQYFEEKLINLGQNQFVFRPQVGFVHNWRKWSYELTGSVSFFSKNPNFSSGQDKTLDPVFALQTHLIKTFKPRYWASVSLAYGLGGQSVVNRQPNNDDRGDVQYGLAFGFPLLKKQGMKVFYIHSETVKDVGSNLNVLGLGWSVLF